MQNRVAIWIGYDEARIFHLYGAGSDEATIVAPLENAQRGHIRGTKDPDGAERFHEDVMHALEGAEEVLVLGQSDAKLDLVRYVHTHHRAFEPRIVGLETTALTTTNELVAFATSYFDNLPR